MCKTLIKRWIFDDSDETEISLPCCWTLLTFLNIYGGYLTQTFNSWTLRGEFWVIFNFESQQPHPEDIAS